MFPEIEKILIDELRIANRVDEIGQRITADLRPLMAKAEQGGQELRLTLIPILTGSMVFVADLIRRLPVKLRLELIGVSSYPGKSMESKGVSISHELPKSLEGQHVLVVDDILDSGATLDVVTRLIKGQRPASLRTCVLLRKPGKARVDVEADYVGFDIPDEFVVGYGLDYDGFYRNLPSIATLRAEAL